MSFGLISELMQMKDDIDKTIGLMISQYAVANPATFFIYIDISDVDSEEGGACDNPDFFGAIGEYMDTVNRWEKHECTNARLVASLTNGQEITLHQVGDFGSDPEPSPDNEKAHRDWLTRQGAERPDEL